jgi:hypothetical protein
MFDLLLSADMMLPDPDGMTEMLVEQTRDLHSIERWRQAFDNHPYIAHFLRVHKSLAVAPTRSSHSGTWIAPILAIRCSMTFSRA